MWKNIKKRSLKFILAFSLWVGLQPPASGCEGGDYWSRFILMNPDIIDNRAWWNFVVCGDVYYGDLYQSNTDERQLAQEWKTKLKLKSSVESIMQYLFYPIPDSANLQESSKKELQKNSTFKTFISFANDCAELSSNEYSWETEEVNRDSVNLLRKNKFNEGWNLFNQQNDDFWKKKYAFQLLKISYYLGDHVRFNKLYSSYFEIENRTTIDWWALHYKSMVLEEQGKVDSANYLHALVFSHSSSKMHESLRWYRFENLNNQLALCKTDEEKGNLYLMAAIRDWDVSIENLEQAYEFDPNNPLLLLALNREMNKIEEDLRDKYNSSMDEWDNYSIDNGTKAAAQISHLYTVVLRMSIIENSKPDYYHLLVSELAILNRNVNEAQQHLNKVSKKKPALHFQKKVFETMLTCITANITQPDGQDKLYQQIQELIALRKNVFESEQILNSLFKYIAEAYISKGKPVYALLLNNFADNYLPGDGWGYDLWYSLDGFDTGKNLEELISLINKPNKTKLEEWIVRPVGGDLVYRELLGTVYARNMQLDKAQKIFNAISEDDWSIASNAYIQMDENPFVLSHTKVYGREYVTWNKSEMLDTLITMEKAPNKTLREYRLLGNIWFNLTKFGNSWYLLHYYYDSNMSRCYDDAKENYYSNSTITWNNVYRDMLNKSMGYYKKALGLTKNKEEQAEFTYMICWCYFLTDKIDDYSKWAGKYEAMKKTQFYQEEKCTITPLYDEREALKSAWDSY